MQKFVITRPDGTEIKVAGYRAGNLFADRQKFASKLGAGRTLPERVDLRKYMTSIERQGDTNSWPAWPPTLKKSSEKMIFLKMKKHS